MFHGLNDSAACCSAGVAKSWAKLPGVLVVPKQQNTEVRVPPWHFLVYKNWEASDC